MRTPVIILVAALALAAQPSQAQPPAAQQPPAQQTTPPPAEDLPRQSDFIERVTNVLAPTTVLDKDGAIVNGLRVSDFVLYDNDKQQHIQADITFQPISLVVVIQANAQVDKMIPKIQKIGAAIDASILGDSGEAAVIAFDHRIQVLQDFTTEKGKIDAAIRKISVYGSSSSVLNDATMQAINMLKRRPKDRRRIILLISETRDGSSSFRPRQVLLEEQLADVLVYSINISHWIAQFTRTAPVPRPDPIPPEAHHVAGGGVMTPTMQSQLQLGNTIPAFVEIFKAVKGVFVDNPSELYTKYTGGKEYTFASQSSLDRAVLDIGEEIHSQYLLSYKPSSNEGGFHTIRVDVLGRPNLKVRTRPGYWVAGPREDKDDKKK